MKLSVGFEPAPVLAPAPTPFQAFQEKIFLC